jgi:NAD-dependent deacetylase
MSAAPEGLEEARRLVAKSRRLVAFTGAGVSTASGVSDFRSPGGVWSRYQPVTIQEFLADPDARRRYWAYKKAMYAETAAARPNAVHETLAALERQGRLLGVITQNVDGLHQDAGSRNVLELHGTNRRVMCLRCGRAYAAETIQQRLQDGVDVPTCDDCEGPLKPATVSFGQGLRQDLLEEAFELALGADLLLVMGSSLVVYPAASIPEHAAASGTRVLIVNRDETPLDSVAAVVLRGAVEELVPALVAA